MSSRRPVKPALFGRQEPRVLTIPPSAVDSRVEDALALWDLTGRRLDPWQETDLEALLAVDEDDEWAASESGLLVSRQQGKGEILQVFDLAHLCLWPKPDGEPKVILHTAHEFATVDAHYRKLKRRVMSTPWLRRQLKGGGVESARGVSGISTGMGRRVFELENGNLMVLQTRTGSAGVGLTVDVLVVDEAQESPSETMDALLFTQDGVPSPQTLYTGTVPTATQDGAHFESVRDRGRSGRFPRTTWIEHSPDGSDDPDLAAMIDPTDREVWAQANPALGRRTTVEMIEDKYNSLKDTNLDGFLKQRLSIWPNPRPAVDVAASDLDMTVWNASAVGERLGSHAVLAVSLGQGGGWSSICGAGRASDGRILLEHLHTAEWTLWVPGMLAELRRRYAAVSIVVDAMNASAILSDLNRAGVRVLHMTTAEVGAAFEIMIESVNEGLVVHPGQAEFTESVKYAQPRKMGRWRTWEQSSPTIPATQTQAATLALWGLKKHESRGGSRTIPSDPVGLGADSLTVSEGVVGILT